ncbi:elongation factor G, partial [Klebsiella pneumoniae]
MTEGEIKATIRKATLSGKFYPVCGGDGRGLIVTSVLDAVINYLPSPLDKPAIKAINMKTKEEMLLTPKDSDKFVALAFK